MNNSTTQTGPHARASRPCSRLGRRTLSDCARDRTVVGRTMLRDPWTQWAPWRRRGAFASRGPPLMLRDRWTLGGEAVRRWIACQRLAWPSARARWRAPTGLVLRFGVLARRSWANAGAGAVRHVSESSRVARRQACRPRLEIGRSSPYAPATGVDRPPRACHRGPTPILSLFDAYARMHARTHARARAHTRIHARDGYFLYLYGRRRLPSDPVGVDRRAAGADPSG